MKSMFGWIAQVFVLGVLLAWVLIAMDDSDPKQKGDQTGAIAAAKVALRDSAKVNGGRFAVDIGASKNTTDESDGVGGFAALVVDNGRGEFVRRPRARAAFRLALPQVATPGTVRVSRTSGAVTESQNPDGQIGALDSDSYGELLAGSSKLVSQVNSEADEDGAVASIELPARLSGILVDFVRVSPRGREILDSFTVNGALPVSLETYLDAAGVTKTVKFAYVDRGASELSFSVTIRPLG